MTIAYFCMEYALEDTLPIFAGGLGVLASDLVLEAGSREDLKLVAIGLFYHEHISTPESFGYKLIPEEITLDLGQGPFQLQVWKKSYGNSDVYLLSGTEITKILYGPDDETMLRQQLILGIGGVRLLKKLNITPDVYHLNEGHSAFAVLGLIEDKKLTSCLTDRLSTIRHQVVATKHTIFSEAGLHLPEETLNKVMGKYLYDNKIAASELFKVGLDTNHPGHFSTTQLLLSTAKIATAVSQTHAVYEKMAHPNSNLLPITNGIYVPRWQSAHNRKALIKYVNEKTGSQLDENILTIVWARRFASYKRPALIFTDLLRLKNVLHNPSQPVQIIISGKVATGDNAGRAMIDQIKDWTKSPDFLNRIVFLPDYNIATAKLLTSGADVWLNTPEIGKEACGTSGMKAALNGALMLSTQDGWMSEVGWADKGWIIPSDNSAEWLYKLIETEIAPIFYSDKNEWGTRMQKTIDVVRTNYTATRMLNDYIEKLYR